MKKPKKNRVGVRVNSNNKCTLSMVGFVSKFLYQTPETTEPICAFALRVWLTVFDADDSVVDFAFKFKWYWEVELHVTRPNGEIHAVTFTPELPILLSQLDTLVHPARDELMQEFPDYAQWGWTARITGTPTEPPTKQVCS